VRTCLLKFRASRSRAELTTADPRYSGVRCIDTKTYLDRIRSILIFFLYDHTMKFSAVILATCAASASAFAPAGAKSARSAFALDATIADTIATLQGPGQVWGAEGIAVGKEESDFKAHDNFSLFTQRLQSTGALATLAGPGPFTVFAPTDTAIQSYEKMTGPVDAAALSFCIVSGAVSSGALGSADLTTLSGSALVYKRQFRKDFINDSIVGEKTFGPFEDFPTDVACDNGIIHAVGIMPSPN
jgi:uncharacterized surface protein with fasciclin (FAS1) repeats